MTAAAAPAAGARGRAAVIGTAATFGLTYGLSAPLIALELADAGFGPTMIGANAATYALGVLGVAPVLPVLVARFGIGRAARAALVLAGAALAAFPLAPVLWLWFPLRAVLGAASESLLVVSETWLNELASEATRARTMAVYTAALSAGIALGPAILAVVGRASAAPFLIGAALALVAGLVLVAGRPMEPRIALPEQGSPLRYLRLAPVAVAATALNAAVESAGLGLLPLYAVDLGWTERSGTVLLTVLLMGAILLQLPIGWLGDRMDRRRLVVLLAALSTAMALVWPLALAHDWLAYPLLFVWGGAFVGIYATTLAIVGQDFGGGDRVGVFATLSLAWGVGALLGPPLGGLAMDLVRHGLAAFAAGACAAFTLFAAWRLHAGRP